YFALSQFTANVQPQLFRLGQQHSVKVVSWCFKQMEGLVLRPIFGQTGPQHKQFQLQLLEIIALG
ncbi:MAG TPA: hypothetical protein PKX51_16540, partial [Cyclobacteriaceae bacterium]|nr:hypothetical protein [Cyclobacteriaceae bacterium]